MTFNVEARSHVIESEPPIPHLNWFRFALQHTVPDQLILLQVSTNVWCLTVQSAGYAPRPR
jgi:hypothetical protein